MDSLTETGWFLNLYALKLKNAGRSTQGIFCLLTARNCLLGKKWAFFIKLLGHSASEYFV